MNYDHMQCPKCGNTKSFSLSTTETRYVTAFIENGDWVDTKCFDEEAEEQPNDSCLCNECQHRSSLADFYEDTTHPFTVVWCDENTNHYVDHVTLTDYSVAKAVVEAMRSRNYENTYWVAAVFDGHLNDLASERTSRCVRCGSALDQNGDCRTCAKLIENYRPTLEGKPLTSVFATKNELEAFTLSMRDAKPGDWGFVVTDEPVTHRVEMKLKGINEE